MARNPTRLRVYSTGGANPVSYTLNRVDNFIEVTNRNNNARKDFSFATNADARRVMQNPQSVCHH